MNNDALPKTGFIRLEQILRHLPLGRSTWWAGVKSGRFPPAIRISAGVTCWRAEDINALLERLQTTPLPPRKSPIGKKAA